MRRIAWLPLALTLTAIPAGGTGHREHVLALLDNGLDRPARLVALDGRTLEVRFRGPSMPGWAFGLEQARSPDGGRLAVFPRPSDAADRLFLIDVHTVRIVGRISVGRPACAAGWPTPRRVVLVVSKPPCYSGEHALEQLVVDPFDRKIVARRPISDPAVILGKADMEDGLVVLLGPHGDTSAPRLVLASADAVRTIALPGIPADGRDLGLAVDASGRRAFVVEPGRIVTDVDLRTGVARRHVLRARRSAAAAKGVAGSLVEAAWAGDGVLALAGGTARGGRFVPTGAYRVDTRTWRVSPLDTTAGSVAAVNGTIVTFQGPHSGVPGAVGTGAAIYTRGGRLRFRVLTGKRVRGIRIRGHYAYVAAEPLTGGVFDLRNGSRTAQVSENVVWSLLTGTRGD